MYSKQYNTSLLQHTEIDNMFLQVLRIEESSHGFNKKVYYELIFEIGTRVIFKSVESNLERLWYIYDTVKSALHGTR